MLKNFINDEAGAVTVDWVVLTAALVGLGLAVMGVVAGGIGNVAADINEDLMQANGAASFTAFEDGVATGGAASTVTP